MRFKQHWDFESDVCASSSEDEQCQSTDDEEVSAMLYGCLNPIRPPGAETSAVVAAVHQLSVVFQRTVQCVKVLLSHLLHLIGTYAGLLILYVYLFQPLPLSALPSHWVSVSVLAATNFKAVLCLGILVTNFARLARAFARQATIARALGEAEFHSAVWQICLQTTSPDKLNKFLQPKRMSYMIGAKWAHACLTVKQYMIVILVLVIIGWYAWINVAFSSILVLKSTSIQTVFALILVFGALCLFSVDILAVKWSCIAAASLIYFCLLMTCSWMANSYQHHRITAFGSFQTLRDALDYVPRVDFDRANWRAGNSGSGPDLVSVIVTIMLDGIVIGAMHEINLIASIVRVLEVCGSAFLGLTGVEALAAVATEFLPPPGVVMILFPYLRRLSESEAAFVFTVMANSVTATCDRRMTYFGQNREFYLIEAEFLRHMSIIASVVICKILYPVRVRHFVSAAGFQYPCRPPEINSTAHRIISGSLEGLKLAMLVSKVVLISRLTSLTICLLFDICLQYISCITHTYVNIRSMLNLVLMPALFPICDCLHTLHLLCEQVIEIFTFKMELNRATIIEITRGLEVFRNFRNLSSGQFFASPDSDLLTAKYFYENPGPDGRRDRIITSAFALYTLEDAGNLAEHAVFMIIFFYHCLTGSRVTGAMATKVVAAVIIGVLINIRLLWHVIGA